MSLDWKLLVAPGYTSDYEMLHDLYILKNQSIERISVFLGVSKQAVRTRISKLGIKLRARGGKAKSHLKGD